MENNNLIIDKKIYNEKNIILSVQDLIVKINLRGKVLTAIREISWTYTKEKV